MNGKSEKKSQLYKTKIKMQRDNIKEILLFVQIQFTKCDFHYN